MWIRELVGTAIWIVCADLPEGPGNICEKSSDAGRLE